MKNLELENHDAKLPIAPAPWHLVGGAAILLSARGAVCLVHYAASPVGPYNEWARAVLTRRGPRIVEMLVTSADSVVGGRENWGFPKQLAALRWEKRALRLRFASRDAVYRLRAWGPKFPARVKFFCVQTLDGRDVRVPFALRGTARLAWRGRQIALWIEEFVFDVECPLELES